EIMKLDPEVRTFQNASPLLVPIIEAGEHRSKKVDKILRAYLKPLLKKHIDTLILGCTHYGILEKNIRRIVGPDISIVSEERVVPEKLRQYLNRHPKTEQKLGKSGKRTFYTTREVSTFRKLGSTFFGAAIKPRKARLE
ncbi:MAG: glutamate racemase, partial [bacterium]|nr:glutamate racemase [bacterium]